MANDNDLTTLDDFTHQDQTNNQKQDEKNDKLKTINHESDDTPCNETEHKANAEVTKNANETNLRTQEDIDTQIRDELNFANELLSDESGSTLSERTVDIYLGYIKQYCRHLYIENTSLLSAGVEDLRLFLKKCASVDYSQSKINGAYSAIKKLYYLVRIESNRSADIDLVEVQELITNAYRTPSEIDREHLTDEEINKLREKLQRRGELMVDVGLETGARNIDITEITLNRVDLEENNIELTDTKNNETYDMRISERLSIKLRQWIKIGRSAFLNAEQSKYLFPKKTGDRIRPQQFRRIVKSAAEDAGIQEVIGSFPEKKGHKRIFGEYNGRTYYKVTPHALRHTLNVRLQEAGLDIEGRAAALNQDSIDVNKNYSKENDEYNEVLKNIYG